MKVLSNGSWEDWSGAMKFSVPTGNPSPNNASKLIQGLGDNIWALIDPVFSDSGDYLYQNLPVSTIDKYPPAVVSSRYMFFNCVFLRYIPNIDFSKSVDAGSMFSGSSIVSTPNMDLSSVTTTSNMFYGCSRLVSPNFGPTPNLQSAYKMYYGCSSLKDPPNMDSTGAKLTSTAYMFYGCSSLTVGPRIDTSSVTDASNMYLSCTNLTTIQGHDLSKTTNLSSFASNCTSLTTVGVRGFTRSLTISGAKLDAAAINTLFTNAGTAYNSSQTIDVRNNPGSAGCDPTIATAKGWTVLR